MRSFVVLLLAIAMISGRSAVAEPPQRIVSAGGDVTEIIYALGAGERIVAVDSTSLYPVEAKALEQIGYIRRLAAEGILSLQPDLIIAAYDAGPPSAVEQLKAAGVRVEIAPRGDSVEGVQDKVRFVGGVLGLAEEADALATRIGEEFASVAAFVKSQSETPRVIFVLSEQDGAPLVGGTDTSADAMIKLAGGINAAGSFSGYKPMSQEAIISAAPDILLMMTQTVERIGGAEVMLSRPEFSLTPAGRDKRHVDMEGVFMLSFGPRMPEALRLLATSLHTQ